MISSRWQLAGKEWRRRPLRSAITTLGVALAVAALASLGAFIRGYQRGLRAELDRLGAHILVVPKGCPFDAASIALHGANWPCYLPGRYLSEVSAVRQVSTAAPALMVAFPRPDGSSEVFVGVTRELLRLRPAWRIDGSFPEAATDVLVGAEVARRNGWRPGQSVSLARLGPSPQRVAGVLAPTGAAEDTFVYLRLETAQRLFRHERELTHILVQLQDPQFLEDAVTQLRGCNAGMDMNVVPLSHLYRTIQQLLHSTRIWLSGVALVALLGAAAGVSNSALMAVNERTREIGVLRAVGASPADIFGLFWLETLQISLAGGALGIAAAMGSARAVETWLRTQLPFTPADRLLQAEPVLLGTCLLAAGLLGSLAGLLPAWRAARLPPIRAIRLPAGH